MHKLSSLVMLMATATLISCAGSKASKDSADSGERYDKATTYQMDTGHRKVNDNIGQGPLGSRTNPIKCEGAEGASEYLKKLTGLHAEALTHSELTDVGVGPFGSLLYSTDVEYTGPAGAVKNQLFFDIDFTGYHEPKVAPGFLLK